MSQALRSLFPDKPAAEDRVRPKARGGAAFPSEPERFMSETLPHRNLLQKIKGLEGQVLEIAAPANITNIIVYEEPFIEKR